MPQLNRRRRNKNRPNKHRVRISVAPDNQTISVDKDVLKVVGKKRVRIAFVLDRDTESRFRFLDKTGGGISFEGQGGGEGDEIHCHWKADQRGRRIVFVNECRVFDTPFNYMIQLKNIATGAVIGKDPIIINKRRF